jgi:hypothetical protein
MIGKLGPTVEAMFTRDDPLRIGELKWTFKRSLEFRMDFTDPRERITIACLETL